MAAEPVMTTKSKASCILLSSVSNNPKTSGQAPLTGVVAWHRQASQHGIGRLQCTAPTSFTAQHVQASKHGTDRLHSTAQTGCTARRS